MTNHRFILSVALILLAVGCDYEPAPPSTRDIQAQAAEQAANAVTFTSNAEIDNIKRRLELTADPDMAGYIVLLNEAGQPIAYYATIGKVTSGGKRLTPPQQRVSGNGVGGRMDFVVEAPSDEGTYGSSNPYVYFWTAQGQYIQWSGDYLFSDQPLRLSVEPLVISLDSEAQE